MNPQQLEQVRWLWVLEHLLVDRGTLFNTVAFVEHHAPHLPQVLQALKMIGQKRRSTHTIPRHQNQKKRRDSGVITD